MKGTATVLLLLCLCHSCFSQSKRGRCASSPCKNGGKCRTFLGTFLCDCATGFIGRSCDVCIHDILIIEDVSRSVGRKSFDEVRRFEQSFLGLFYISQFTDRVAYMVFSANASVKLTLKEPLAWRVLTTLKKQTYESGSETNIVEAINVAVDSVFKQSNGDRPDVNNAVIMFTDGFDTESKREDINASISQLHAKAEVFVVSLSDVEANSSVNMLASSPSNIFKIGSDAAVSSLQSRLRNCKSSK